MPIKLTVSQPAPVSLSYVEAAIKPETVGHVTPTYEEQTVYPAAGTTFGRVEVDAIPDPTAIKEIDSNGDHDVRRYGVARVDVQPTLQSKTATPTEQAQTVLPDTGYDGLESVNIARIPTEYIIPTGTKNISQNGTESVREYDSVNVSVEPTLQDKTIVPTKQTQTVNADSGYDGLDIVEVEPIPSEYIIPQGKTTITQNGTVDVSQYAETEVDVKSDPDIGFVFEDFNASGQPSTLRTVGMTSLPSWCFYNFTANRYGRPWAFLNLTKFIINEGVTTISDYAFRDILSNIEVYFPSTVSTISGYLFASTPVMLMDFSKCRAVPTINSIPNHAEGCVIRVKQSLLAEWQAATNWNALTGVVWEGV